MGTIPSIGFGSTGSFAPKRAAILQSSLPMTDTFMECGRVAAFCCPRRPNMSAEPVVTAVDPRLLEALVGLLSHDLRAPLGPLALATSSIAEDPGVPASVRDLARFAEAQSARLARLIDAVIRCARGLGIEREGDTDLVDAVEDAVEAFRALGGSARFERPEATCHAAVHRGVIRDALISVLEVSAGEGGSATVLMTAVAGSARLTIRGSDPSGCAAAFAARYPSDWRATLALGASATFAAYGGALTLRDGAVVARLPVAGC